MAKFKSLAHFLATITSGVGVSKHKTARAHRFIFKHRRAHKHIIPKLIKEQQDHEREVHRVLNEKRKIWAQKERV